jgi:hypothetical protein
MNTLLHEPPTRRLGRPGGRRYHRLTFARTGAIMSVPDAAITNVGTGRLRNNASL